MKIEYIGVRFPKKLKDLIQEKANANGQSMTKYMEELLTSILDNDGDGEIQESQYNELMERLNKVESNKIEAMETPILDAPVIVPEVLEDETAPDNESEQVLPIVEESIIETVELLATVPTVERSPIDALRQSLSPVLAGELNAEIAATWSSMNGTTQEPKNKVLIADFFENLAENLTDKADAPRKNPPRNQDELLSTLPPSYQAEIIPIIEAAILEFKGDIPKNRFFKTLADLLDDAAERMYIDARAFELAFTRAEYALIEQMIQQTNERRKKPLADLEAWIYYKLGLELRETGDGGVWSRDNTPMIELGEMLVERGGNRKAV